MEKIKQGRRCVMGKDIWTTDCVRCEAKDKMIVVEDNGDDLLEQEYVCSECDYSVHRRQEWRTVQENYLNDAERKEFIEEYKPLT